MLLRHLIDSPAPTLAFMGSCVFVLAFVVPVLQGKASWARAFRSWSDGPPAPAAGR